jgi:hypothetical protein
VQPNSRNDWITFHGNAEKPVATIHRPAFL